MTTQRTVGAIWIALVFALVPLALLPGIYEYALLPKRWLLAVLTTLGLAHLLWRVQSERQLELPRNTLSGLLAAYTGLALASALHAPNTDHALGEAAFLIVLFSLGTLAATSLDSARGFTVAIWGVTFAALLTSTIGVLEYQGLSPIALPSNGLPSATFGFRNFAAMFLICAIPATLYLALATPSTWLAVLPALATALSVVFLVYTRTRGAWLGLTMGAVVGCALVVRSSLYRRNLPGQLGSTAKRIVLCGAVLLTAALAPLDERFEDTGLQRFDEKKADVVATLQSLTAETGDRGRLAMWARTADLIWDNLLTGVGLGSWQHIYPAYDDGVMLRPDSSPKRPHNDYLWVTAESGILAGLIYAAIPLLLLVELYRMRDDEAWSALAPFLAVTVAGFATHGFFSFPREQPQAISFIFAIGGAVAAARGGTITLSRGPASIVVGILLLLAMGAAATTHRQIRFDRHFLAALAEEDGAKWGNVEREARLAVSSGLFRPHALIVLGRSLEQQGRHAESESAYLRALEQAPYAWRAHNGFGIIYKRTGRHDEALAQYEAALSIYPDAKTVRTNLGALYRATGNVRRAEAEYRKILSVDDRDAGANNNLANILKARGEVDSAEVFYRRALETDPDLAQAHHNLAELLVRREDYITALHHYRTATELSPREALTHWGTGRALEIVGDPIGAERAYRKAIEVDPRFPRAYFSLGVLRYGFRRWKEAKSLFETFLDLWDGDQEFEEFAEGRIRACEKNMEREARAAGRAD